MPKCNACAIPIKLLELLLPAIHTWAINTIPMSLIYSVPNIIQSQKFCGDLKIFLHTVKKFPRRDLTFLRNPKYFRASPRISAQANKYLRTCINVLGANNIYLGDYNFSA